MRPLVIAALCALLYLGSLRAPFVYDDMHTIVQNPYITSISHAPGFFLPGQDWGARTEHSGWRPLWYLSFTLNYLLGGLDPTGYHIVNVAFHALAAVLVYFAALTLFRRRTAKPELAALFAGLVFAAHPVQTESVSYIVSRSALMAALFYILSFMAYVRFRDKGGIAPLAACFAAFAFAAMSKETAASFPVMIIAYEYSLREKPRPGWAIAAVCAAGAAYVAFRLYLAGISGGTVIVRGIAVNLMTETYVVVQYIGKALWPVNLCFDPEVRDVVSAADPRFYLSAAALGLIGYAIFLLYRRDRLAGFLALWPFIAILPETAYPNVDAMAEHRLYLPMAGAAMLMGYAASRVMAKEARRKACVAVAAVVVAALSIGTVSRNRVYASEIALWEDTVKKSPDKAMPAVSLGAALFRAGRTEESVSVLTQATVHGPDNPKAHNNLAFVLSQTGRYEDAKREYLRAIEIEPANYYALDGLAYTYTKLGDNASAEGCYRKEIRLRPDMPLAHRNLGALYLGAGRYKEAADELLVAVRLAPHDLGARQNLGAAYLLAGDYKRAGDVFAEALRAAPEDARTHFNMSKALEGGGDHAGAEEEMRLYMKYGGRP